MFPFEQSLSCGKRLSSIKSLCVVKDDNIRCFLHGPSNFLSSSPDKFLITFLSLRTFEHVHRDAAGVAHAGLAEVLPAVLHPGLLDEEEASRDVALLRDLGDAAADAGVGDGLAVVIPEDVLRGLGAVPHQAGQVHGEALLQVDVGAPEDLGVRL